VVLLSTYVEFLEDNFVRRLCKAEPKTFIGADTGLRRVETNPAFPNLEKYKSMPT